MPISALDTIEMAMIRTAIGIFLLFVIYAIFSKTIIKNINKKVEQINVQPNK